MNSKPIRKPATARALQLRIQKYAAAGPNCPTGHPWMTNAKFNYRGYRFCGACAEAKAEQRRNDPVTFTGQCPRGHAYTRENTIINRLNSKVCRACLRDPNAKPRPLKSGLMDELLLRARKGATTNELAGEGNPKYRGKGIVSRLRLIAAYSADTPEAKELKQLIKQNAEAAVGNGRPQHRWSAASLALLESELKNGTSANMAAELINKRFDRDFSVRAIYTKAHKLGLVTRRVSTPKILVQKLPPLVTALHFPAGSILDRISAVVPRHLARDHRDDVIADMALAISEGSLHESDISRRVREFVNAGYRREHNRHRTVSLDEPLYDDSTVRLIDRIAAVDWQSDFYINEAP